MKFHEEVTLFSAFGICAYPGDLNVVQLLLPVEDTLHPVHPHVDVSNQYRLADPLNQSTEGSVEGLQQFPY